MEEVERASNEKYKIIKEQMKNADNEHILMAINSLSTQLEREIVEDMEKELETLS